MEKRERDEQSFLQRKDHARGERTGWKIKRDRETWKRGKAKYEQRKKG